MKIILASKSPRRKEILENLGLSFQIITADTDEQCGIKDPEALVSALATRKGRAVLALPEASELSDCLVIACDTLVYANGEFLGKPRDAADAERMLCMLSDSSHSVVSGIYLCYNGKEVTAACTTQVIFDKLSKKDIQNYIESGEPFDKAGAYAIQGRASVFIKAIEGDYFNVVGLPVNTLYNTLKEKFGIDLQDKANG